MTMEQKNRDQVPMTEQRSREQVLAEAFPFWKQLNEQQQRQLADSSRFYTYKKGAVMHEGRADCPGLFVLLSGRVKTYMITDEGKEITLFRLLERDICLLSASCMFKNINFEVYIQAEEETDVLIVPVKVYNEMSKRLVCIADFTNELLSSRFSDVMWVMEQVLFMSFDRRLALFLLEEASYEQSDVLHITHEEIARHMGTAREVVSRMLRYFSGEGLVTVSRGEIRLLDRGRLEIAAGSAPA